MPRETPYPSYQDDYAEEDKILNFPSTSGQDHATWKTFFCKATQHPAKANLAMIEWIIQTYTKPGDIIVDPMAGTGSTCIIAMRNGRHAIAGEYEWNYAFRFLLKNIDNARMIGSWGEIGKGFTIIGDSRKMSTMIPRALELMGLKNRPIKTTMFSPPYVNTHIKRGTRGEENDENYIEKLASIDGRSIKAARKNVERWTDYGDDPDNIANMPQGSTDAIITSPPYAGTLSPKSGGTDTKPEQLRKVLIQRGHSARQIKKIMSGKASTTSVTMSKDARGYSTDDDNIGNLPIGNVDGIVTSPPYVEALGHGSKKGKHRKITAEKSLPETQYGDYDSRIDKGNIGNLPGGEVDGIVTSPPYEGSLEHRGGNQELAHLKGVAPYTTDKDNIGNMTTDTYMQAMYDLYQDAWKYTKDGGLMILIVKNFVKHKRPVDLASDTIKIAELAGWLLMDHHYFRLPDKSFWIIQHTSKFAKRLYMLVNGVPGVEPQPPVNPCHPFIGTKVGKTRIWSEKDVFSKRLVRRKDYKQWQKDFKTWQDEYPEAWGKYELAFKDTHIANVHINEPSIIKWFKENGCTHPWADYEDILVFVKPSPAMILYLKSNKILIPEIWSDQIITQLEEEELVPD